MRSYIHADSNEWAEMTAKERRDYQNAILKRELEDERRQRELNEAAKKEYDAAQKKGNR